MTDATTALDYPADGLGELAVDNRRHDFDWELVPDEICVAIARQLTDVASGPDEARAYLARTHPVPDDGLLRMGRRSCDVAHVIRSEWPRRNALVLDHLYGLAESYGLVDAGKRKKRKPSDKTKLGRLRDLTLQVKFRRALLETLLRFGSRSIPKEELQDLPPFFIVPSAAATDAGELFPYQVEATKRLRERFSRERFGMRGLVVMPTGSGKTRTTVTWLLDDVVGQGHKVLWVTHRTELMEQTARAFIAGAPRLAHRGRDRLGVRLIGGGFSPGTTAASPSHDVAIASVATLARNAKALKEWLSANDVVVVFDEAHHSPAKSWRDILKLATEVTNDAVIGLTATPTRMQERERRALIRLYGGDADPSEAFVYESHVDELIDQGYLARPSAVALETKVDVLKKPAIAAARGSARRPAVASNANGRAAR